MSVKRRSPTLSEAMQAFRELRRLCNTLPALESFEKHRWSYWRSKRTASTPESSTGGIKGPDGSVATGTERVGVANRSTAPSRRPCLQRLLTSWIEKRVADAVVASKWLFLTTSWCGVGFIHKVRLIIYIGSALVPRLYSAALNISH